MNSFFISRSRIFISKYWEWVRKGLPDPWGKLQEAIKQEHPITKKLVVRSIEWQS